MGKCTVDNITPKLCSSTTISEMAKNNNLQELHKLNNNIHTLYNNTVHYKAMHSEQTCQELLMWSNVIIILHDHIYKSKHIQIQAQDNRQFK